MKTEYLKSIGLTEEQIAGVMAENGKDIGAEKAKTEAANIAKAELETQIAQRDKDFKDLQKAAEGNEALTKQVADLQEAAKTAKSDYDTKLKRAAAKAEIGDTVHDMDLYLGLLDLSKVELDENGGIKAGLKEQREVIDKAKPFLLKTQEQSQQQQKPQGFKPADGQQPNPVGSTGDYTARYQTAKTLSERVSIKQEAAAAGVFLS